MLELPEGIASDIAVKAVFPVLAIVATKAQDRSVGRRRWRLADPATLAICVPEAAPDSTGDYVKRTVGSGPVTAVATATSSLIRATKKANVSNVRFGEQITGSQDLGRDLVVIGGPKTNAITEILLGSTGAPGDLRRRAHLVQDGRTVVVGTRTWRSIIDDRRSIGSDGDSIVRDYGVVVRCESPLSTNGARMVLLSGAHTYGSVAAAEFVARNLSAVFRRRDTLWVLEVDVVDHNVAGVRVVHRERFGHSAKRLRQRDIAVVEEDCRASGSGKPNEDHVFIDSHAVAVLDGVTSKAPPGDSTEINPEHAATTFPSPGAAAVRHIAAAIESELPRHTPATKLEFAKIVSRSVRPRKGSAASDRMAAVCALYHKPSNKIWRIGDITVVINGEVHRPRRRLRDELLAEKRAAHINELLESGQRTIDDLRAHDEGREAVLEEIKLAQLRANKDYGVINGKKISYELIEEFDVPPDAEIILASDGFACVEPTLEKTMKTHTQAIVADPLCVGKLRGLKAVKPDAEGYDDMSYLRFQVTQHRRPSAASALNETTPPPHPQHSSQGTHPDPARREPTTVSSR